MVTDALHSKALANVVAIIALVVAALSLWHAAEAQSASKKAQDRANSISEEVKGIQQQALSVQKDALSRTGAYVRIDAVEVVLQFGDQSSYLGGYGSKPGEIPLSDWNQATGRWVRVQAANIGARDAVIRSMGLGTSPNMYLPQTAATLYCTDGDPGGTTSQDLCGTPLKPGITRTLWIGLTADTIGPLTDDWRKRGVEVCVDSRPYGVPCETNKNTVLPADWQAAFKPTG